MPNYHRELVRRQHRWTANLLALYAWKTGNDALVVSRTALEQLLSLDRFKATRLAWLEVDVAPWFPYLETLVRSAQSFGSIVLSRKPIPPLRGRMPDADRATAISRDGLQAGLLDVIDMEVVGTEAGILGLSVSVAVGAGTIDEILTLVETVAPEQ